MSKKSPLLNDFTLLTADQKNLIISLYKEKNLAVSKIKIKLNISSLVIRKVLIKARIYKKKKNSSANQFSTPNRLTGIYKIENTLTKKIYIGQSVDIFRRWQQHMGLSNKSDLFSNSNADLSADIQKYGLKNFSFTLLFQHQNLTKDELFMLENTFMRDYRAVREGYNKRYTNYKFYDFDAKTATDEQILKAILDRRAEKVTLL